MNTAGQSGSPPESHTSSSDEAPPADIAGGPSPSAPDETAHDLAICLLHGAVQVSHAVDRLHRLAGHAHDDDPAALHQVTEAISIMARARSALIHNADRLTGRTRSSSWE